MILSFARFFYICLNSILGVEQIAFLYFKYLVPLLKLYDRGKSSYNQ